MDAVARLLPDLVLANQEENSRTHLEQLAQLGLPLLVSFPKTVAEGIAHLARLAKVLDLDARELLRRGYAAIRDAEAALRARRPLRAFVPIWMDPLMTVNGQTYMSDALRLGAGEGVFADRQRLCPWRRTWAGRCPARGRGIRALSPGDGGGGAARAGDRAAAGRATSVLRGGCPGVPPRCPRRPRAPLRRPGLLGAQAVDGIPRLRALMAPLR